MGVKKMSLHRDENNPILHHLRIQHAAAAAG